MQQLPNSKETKMEAAKVKTNAKFAGIAAGILVSAVECCDFEDMHLELLVPNYSRRKVEPEIYHVFRSTI